MNENQYSPKNLAAITLVGVIIFIGASVFFISSKLQKNTVYTPPAQASTNAVQTALPPVPSGLPNVFGFGLFNDNLSNMHPGVPYNYRYQYMAGDWIHDYGTNYVTNYINATPQNMVPAFIIYRFCSLNGGGNCSPNT